MTLRYEQLVELVRNADLGITITKTVEPDAFFERYKVKFGVEEKIFKDLDSAKKWLYEKCDMHVNTATAEPNTPKRYKRKLLP